MQNTKGGSVNEAVVQQVIKVKYGLAHRGKRGEIISLWYGLCGTGFWTRGKMDGAVRLKGMEVVKWSGEPKVWVKNVYPSFPFIWLAKTRAWPYALSQRIIHIWPLMAMIWKYFFFLYVCMRTENLLFSLTDRTYLCLFLCIQHCTV